jgi:hypothetical protein
LGKFLEENICPTTIPRSSQRRNILSQKKQRCQHAMAEGGDKLRQPSRNYDFVASWPELLLPCTYAPIWTTRLLRVIPPMESIGSTCKINYFFDIYICSSVWFDVSTSLDQTFSKDMKGLFTYFRAAMFFFQRTYDPATFGK